MRDEVRRRLAEAAEPGYRDFMQRLLPGTEDLLGVRLPILRRLAKEIAARQGAAFIDAPEPDRSFEETMLRGLVLDLTPMEFTERLRRTVAFVPRIRNWAVCDSFCGSFPLAPDEKATMYTILRGYAASAEEYEARFAAVMLLCHYLDPEWIDRSLLCLPRIHAQGYYAETASAWALSMAFVADPARVRPLLTGPNLAPGLRKKAIRKIRESRQVSPAEKQRLQPFAR